MPAKSHLYRYGKSSILILLLLLVFAYPHTGNTRYPYAEVLAWYNNADRLFNLEEPTDATDSLALKNYAWVINRLESLQVYDSILFQSYLHTGILLDVKSGYRPALQAYLSACRVKQKNPGWSDSVLYRAWVYAGTAYYNLNNFDSSSYYLLAAEQLTRRFPAVPEKERMYNALGALYYENGNYQQSKNYFMQALELLRMAGDADTYSAMNFENNIAAALYKLGLYQPSLDIYRKLLTENAFENYTCLNIGKSYAALQQYDQAIRYFRKVNTQAIPRVLNEMASTWLSAGRYDSATYCLDKFVQLSKAGSSNSIDAGINALYRGNLLCLQQQYESALNSYQQAINAFSGSFNNNDVFVNPTAFTGSFASYRLFDALFQKAKAFNIIYRQHKQEKYLAAACNTYQSAITLFRYIEKSFETDDAKLFLKQNSQPVYREAVSVCLQMHQLHPDAGYLEQAFMAIEKSKASVMESNVTEHNLKKAEGIDPALLQQERNLKYNIARLNIKSDQATDSAQLNSWAQEKAHFEIELSKLHNAIENNSAYYQLKYNSQYPGIEALQQQLNKRQAVISFFASGNRLLAFLITKKDFKHLAWDSFPEIKSGISRWITALSTTGSGRRFKARETGEQLYRQLVKPLQETVGDKTEWIILPDDLLYYLPFESLPADAEGSRYLLETTTISYQFSSRFLVAPPALAPVNNYSVLSFAPFSGKTIAYNHPGYPVLNRLPASRQEIDHLAGKQFLDSGATKQQFLEQMNHFPVIHLATHAIADLDNTAGSFIAFYPTGPEPADNGLYLEELYGLNLDSTELVIISACETGNGELVSSEGVMSLTRAFMYAGSAGIVSSLWKADDEATAFIVKQFHHYLQQGYNKAKALQQAKLDYLKSNTVNKTPNYWAHLILTGNSRPVVRKNTAGMWGWWIAVGAGMAGAGWMIRSRRKKKKKSTGFHSETDFKT